MIAADFLERHLVACWISGVDVSQRRPDGEFRAPAGRRLDPAGRGILDRSGRRGLAMARLADERGYFRAVQSLVIEKR